MKKTAIITDSNSGITQDEAKQMGISLIAMPFTINGELYHEGIDLDHEKFFELQESGTDISTSQPSITEVTTLWDSLLKEYDEIVHIPMSSGLSSSCQTANMLAQDYDGKVQVVDNQRISVTQKSSVLNAIELAKRGYGTAQIKEILEETKFDSSIYVTLETLKYLKKGGRITPAAAALGTILRLKPVLQIQGEKLDAYSKARTYKIAKNTMLDAIAKDIEERFDGKSSPEDIYIAIAHTDNLAAAEEFRDEVKAIYPEHDIYIDHLSLSVACHIGPGALAITATKVLKY